MNKNSFSFRQEIVWKGSLLNELKSLKQREQEIAEKFDFDPPAMSSRRYMRLSSPIFPGRDTRFSLGTQARQSEATTTFLDPVDGSFHEEYETDTVEEDVEEFSQGSEEPGVDSW